MMANDPVLFIVIANIYAFSVVIKAVPLHTAETGILHVEIRVYLVRSFVFSLKLGRMLEEVGV